MSGLPLLHRLALPIMRGPLSGLWWSPAADDDGFAALLGQHHSEQFDVLESTVGPGDRVLDIGAGTGFFSMLFAKLVTRDGNVVAIESNPQRARLANYHADMNHLSHVQVSSMAVAGKEEVQAHQADTTVDSLVQDLEQSPTHLRLATRSHELHTLDGAAETIREFRPTLFLSTHDEDSHHRCCKWLVDHHYELRPLEGSSVADTRHLICIPNSLQAA